MCKKMIILLLCAAFLLPIVAQAEENAIVISTAQELCGFAENCRMDSFSQGLTVRLACDIDLTGISFAGIPIFCGTFDGNGHKISGFEMKEAGSNVGVFRYLADTAVVKDLNVEGVFTPVGSKNYVGGIAGSNAGLIENCSFIGTVAGNSYVGGIAGTNLQSGIIRNNQTQGEIRGIHFVGGIAGENHGLIEACENAAKVNAIPVENDLRLEDITVESITGTEIATTATDVGGIAGNSMGVIMNSVNNAEVGYAHIGYNVGGIAGVQMGYIAGCENFGRISGRKEVGGIVGQLEPITHLEYNKDTLQILKEELDVLATLTDAALQNGNANMLSIQNQLNELRSYIESAQAALESLLVLPDLDQMPQWENYQSSWNTLTANLQKAMNTIVAISVAVEDTATSANRELVAIYQQVSVIRGVLNSDTENVGGTITDVSDSDTETDTTAKIFLCKNYGVVSGEINTGGIVGAMAVENDLDPESDVNVSGSSSLYFDTRLRAVVHMCTNSAVVNGEKNNAGGIVGFLHIGLVKNSVNTGEMNAADANSVGGIAGVSAGFIRNCYVRCRIDAQTTAGGIAGQADCVSDCGAIVLVQAIEKKGAILGTCDDRTEIVNNFYYPISADIGGIDGISFNGFAQPCQREQLPDSGNEAQANDVLTVTFRTDTAILKTLKMPVGQRLERSEIPELPQIDGCAGKWLDIPDDPVWFDITVQAAYSAYVTSVQSDQVDENGRPLFLVVGILSKDSVIRSSDCTVSYPLQDDQTSICQFALEAENVQFPVDIRYLVTESFDPESTTLYIYSDGKWKEVAYKKDGSYIVLPLNHPQAQFALIETQSAMWMWFLIAGAALLIVITIVVVKIRHNKKIQAE